MIEALRDVMIADIGAGHRHSLAVSAEHVPYSWGDGSDGRLGHAEYSEQSKPRAISYFLENGIEAIACFAESSHSAILSSSGELYLFGNNSQGQLGFDDGAETSRNPKKLPIENIKHVSLGRECSALIAWC